MGLPSRGTKPTQREDPEDMIEDAGQEDQVRLNADVPESLRTQIQIQAAKEKRPIRIIVIDAMNEYYNTDCSGSVYSSRPNLSGLPRPDRSFSGKPV